MDNHKSLLPPPAKGGTAIKKLTSNCLSVEVSCFTHTGDKSPTRRLLIDLLRDTSRIAEVNRVRGVLSSEGQKAYKIEKANQPCFLVSVLCENGHKESCIVGYTGLLSFDIDSKENPEWTTDEIKDCLRQYTNIAYCGLSLSGEGVWGIVLLAYPEQHTQHFRALTRIFRRIGENHKGIPLVIDQSCRNVNRLRFHSYDPDPVYRSDAIVLAACDEEVKPTIAPSNSHKRPSKPLMANDALRICVRMVEASTDGGKHIELLKASRLAGGYIAGGWLDEKTAIKALEEAINRKPNVHDFTAAQRTIRDGITNGKLNPLQAKPH